MFESSILKTSIGRLRLFGFLEGLSLLALMFFAMPMKYIWHDPSYVRIVGSAHGALFILFLVQIYSVMIEKKWNPKELPLKLFISCFIPFGTFYLDHKILKNI